MKRIATLGYAIAIWGVLIAWVHAQPAPRALPDSDLLVDHAWASFPVGSWKQVRVHTEVLDAEGRVIEATTSTTTTTLIDAKDDCFTLKAEVIVERGGKIFTPTTRTLAQGYFGQPCEVPVTITRDGPGVVNLSGKRVVTENRTVSFQESPGKRRVSTLQFSRDATPRILHRETRLLDTDDKPIGSSASVDVVAVEMPCRVRTETKTGWHVRTIQWQGNQSIVTVEVHCPAVPGGVISHSSKTLENNDRVVERSTLELVDYGVGDGNVEVPQVRRGLFQRRRSRVNMR